MNRLVAEGILMMVRDGARVLVVEANLKVAHESFTQVARHAEDDPLFKIRRANGEQRIEDYRGGRVWFTSVQSSSPRGLAVDMVYCGSSTSHLSPEAFVHLYPCLAASEIGEMIRA